MRPLKKRVIIKRKAVENATESGIIVKADSQAPEQAVVISLGPDCDCGLKIDDQVLLDWRGAIKFKEDFYVVDENNIIAVVEK
jgi:chaperonin GroES